MANCIFVVLVLLTILEQSLSTGHSNLPARVNIENQLIVTRGGQVELQQTFTINATRTNFTECKIRYIHKQGLSCGEVRPSVFDCDYNGSLTYQHYGCLLENELVTFQLSFITANHSFVDRGPNQNPVTLHIFSLELVVRDSNTFSAIELIRIDQRPDHGSQLVHDSSSIHQLVFPNELIGKCHYEILNKNFSKLSLPSYGDLVLGETNSLLPCGYVHSHQIQYRPKIAVTNSCVTDYILLRIYSYDHNHAVPFYKAIALMDSHKMNDSDNNCKQPAYKLAQQDLSIQQAVNTPVTLDAFNADSIHPFGLAPIKYTVEVHPNVGSFHTVQSTALNVSHTEFTRDDLVNGRVTFYPHDNGHNQSPVLFRYSAIYDVAGVLMADGHVAVTVHNRIWRWPTQRTNNPLPVLEDNIVTIDSKTIDFYLLGECILQASMRLSKPPLHGQLLYINGSIAENEMSFLVGAVKNGTALAYEHSGDDSFSDEMVWEVSCLNGPVILVTMTVLVGQVDDAPPTFVGSSSIVSYHDWSLPLSISNFPINDPDSCIGETMIQVYQLEGTLVKAAHSLDFNSSTWLFPFAKLSEESAPNVSEFSLSDLEKQLIWYTPPNDTATDTIVFKLVDSSGNEAESMFSIDVNVYPHTINKNLSISTEDPYPPIRNELITMTIYSTQGVYITPRYLYTAVPPLTDEGVVYLVTAPIEHGYLCILSDKACNSSVSHFTQRDINQQRVYFLPSSQSFQQVNITMTTTAHSIQPYNPNLFTLSITFGQNEDRYIGTSEPFWVFSGSEKSLKARYFRFYHMASNAIFRVTKTTEYGTLSYRPNGKEEILKNFTLQDVRDKKVWYKHNRASSFACSDSFDFDILLDNEIQSSSSMQILIRHGRSNLDVSFTDGPHQLFGQNRFVFKKQDFLVTSSFCPELVKFNLVLPPSLGVLSLIDIKNDLVVQLQTHSTFTIRDINTGLLHYSLLNSRRITTNISDHFVLNATDPISSWPGEINPLRQTQIGSYSIIIEPAAGVDPRILHLKITSPRPLSWLPAHGKYGAVLQQSDIDITNSTVEPRAVHIQLQACGCGLHSFLVNSTIITSVFTVENIYAGEVTYTIDLREDNVNAYHVSVGFDIYVVLNIDGGTTHRAPSYSFEFEWAIIEFEQTAITVSEEAGRVEFVIRRSGHLWFESRLLFTTHSGSANGTNCTDTSHSQTGFDFCHISKEIVFKPNMTEYSLSVPLLDDQYAEIEKIFTVQLSQPINAVFQNVRSTTNARVTLTDTADYAAIRIEGRPTRSPQCDLELTVHENKGILAINLTRTGNLVERAGIICKTQSITHSAVDGLDYMGRTSTVWFEANQTSSTCNVTIINDVENDSSERFFVILEETMDNAKAKPIEGSSILCVHITADIEDEPGVYFEPSEITVQESETEDVFGTFTIHRRGTDLDERTVLKYRNVLFQGDTATYDDDFEIFADSIDSNECTDPQPGESCVQFPPELPMKTLSFKVRPDTILEGNETFHLEIQRPVHLAHVEYPYELKVTILDASQPPIIGFETTHLLVEESRSWHHINVTRSGHIQGESRVVCKFKALSNQEHDAQPLEDFLVPSKPEEIVFGPGQTVKRCSFGVILDTRYERLESFNVTLETSDNLIMLCDNNSTATITIEDPEDIPTIDFDTTRSFGTEPLSRHSLDSQYTKLTLVRSGDVNRTVAIQYGFRDGTAKGGLDFDNRTARGIVTFQKGETVMTISIKLLPNNERNVDSDFTVFLSLINDTVPLVAIGANRTAIVHITNRCIIGPIFPGKPRITNSRHNSIQTQEDVYYDAPLKCTVPCTAEYTVSGIDRNRYLEDCAQQNIDLAQTLFIWEYSINGEQFNSFNKSTVTTSVDSQILEPVYLERGLYVRCTCVPTNYNGSQGHSRTSEVVYLSMNMQTCGTEEGQQAEVTLGSYDTFAGRSEDLVEVSISLPHIPNTIPIVLMEPLQEDDIESVLTDIITPTSSLVSDSIPRRHSCSNLNRLRGKSSLMTSSQLYTNEQQLSIYSHLNYKNCVWRFSVWLPIHLLIEECEVDLRTSESKIVVDVNALYIHINTKQRIEVAYMQNITSELHYLSSSVYLPPPLHYHATKNDTIEENLYIYPVTAQSRPNSTSVVFYSVTNNDSNPLVGIFSSSSSLQNQSLTLLYSDDNQNKQAWLMLVNEQLTVFNITLYKLRNCEACAEIEQYSFFLQVVPMDRSLVPSLDVTVCLQREYCDKYTAVKTHATSSVVLNIGTSVSVSLTLGDHQRIQPGYSLNLNEVHLCKRSASNNCSMKISLWKCDTNGNSPSFDFRVHSSNEISFSIDTAVDLISSEPSSTSTWQLSLSYSLRDQNTSTDIVTQTSDLSITFLSVEENITATIPPSQKDQAYLYAAVAVFIIAIIIAVVTFVVVGLMIWMWKVKMRLKAKVGRVIASQRNDSISGRQLNPSIRRISGAASGRTRVSIGTIEEGQALRRTHSTIGFPATAEKYKREKRKFSETKSGGVVSSKPTSSLSTPNPLLRSRSLPNLSYVSTQPIEGFFPEPRRNLNKVHTKVVKITNKQLEKVNSASGAKRKLMKAYKVDNLKTMQEMTPKRNNYGVNEGKLNTEKEVHRVELVSYAVRSLAASAKTPEPGSVPRTAL